MMECQVTHYSWSSVSLMQTLSPKASDSQSVTSGLSVRKDGLKRAPLPFRP